MTWSTLHCGQTEWTGDPGGAATEQPALGPQATITADAATGGAWQVINYAGCLNASSYYDIIVGGTKYCYIAINAAFAELCGGDIFGQTTPPGNTSLAGTGHMCEDGGSSTGWLTTTWPITAGEEFELVLKISDTSDEIYDSTVLIDNFQWEGGTVQQGTVSHN